MDDNFLKGLYRTIMIERIMDRAISGNQVDGFKESIIRFCESKIADLPLSDQEKEEQKQLMKQSADAYNHGIKDGLRMIGKLA